jgi:hypothetical protein
MGEKNRRQSVFISHSHADAPLARELSKALANGGIRPWLPDEEIRPGERWKERLLEELRSARVVIVLLTPASVQSPWTFFEVGAAVADHKIIIPVLSRDMKPEDVPAILRQFQWVRASSPDEAGEEIARAIKSAVSEPASPP